MAEVRGGRLLAVDPRLARTPGADVLAYALDLPRFLVGHLDTTKRRRHENRLLEIYHSMLTARGITGYSVEQGRDDHRMALVMTASRLASAVGFHPGLTATPDGFWNVVSSPAKALARAGSEGDL